MTLDESGLLIKQISPFCLLQDLGRFGYKHFGVTHSGAVDPYLLRVANLLVGNPQGEACLEFTSLGGEFEVTAKSLCVALAGDFPIFVNGEERLPFSTIQLAKGDLLKIESAVGGIRGYLAIAGGFSVRQELGSYSHHLRSKLGGFAQSLHVGMQLPVNITLSVNDYDYFLNRTLYRSNTDRIRVILGPQVDYFTRKGLNDFLNTTFVVSNEFDRMGYCLEGTEIEFVGKSDMISEPTLYGSVQVPPSGKPVVLMADCGTSGGYPKIATVISVDRGVLAQKKAGSKVLFDVVSVGQAQQLLKDQERYFKTFDLKLSKLSNFSLAK